MEFEYFFPYKYVRLSDDEFRFAKMFVFGKSHQDLVKDGEVVISAGVISIWPDKIKLIDEGSITLEIFQSKKDDFPLLEKIIGKKFNISKEIPYVIDGRHERLLKRSIPKSQLIHDAYYRGRCRNATTAKWDSEKGVFWYVREKFGSRYNESINHPEDDNGFDLFYPFEKL